MRKTGAFFGFLLLLAGLAACGVRPVAVDPPDGQPDRFPRTYPNPTE